MAFVCAEAGVAREGQLRDVGVDWFSDLATPKQQLLEASEAKHVGSEAMPLSFELSKVQPELLFGV